MKNTLSQVTTPSSLRLRDDLPLPNMSQHCTSELENLAHELRQPLSVIESLAFYLELTSKDDGARSHYQQIQAMVRNAHRILAEATSR